MSARTVTRHRLNRGVNPPCYWRKRGDSTNWTRSPRHPARRQLVAGGQRLRTGSKRPAGERRGPKRAAPSRNTDTSPNKGPLNGARSPPPGIPPRERWTTCAYRSGIEAQAAGIARPRASAMFRRFRPTARQRTAAPPRALQGSMNPTTPTPLRRLSVIACLLLTGGLAAAKEPLGFGVPIHVIEQKGVDRSHELVSVGIPLAETEQVFEPTELRITSPDIFHEIPVQWKVLTRWRGKPGDTTRPIKVVLAKFLVTLDAHQSRTYRVYRRTPSDGPPAEPGGKMTVTTQGLWVVVDTPAWPASTSIRASSTCSRRWRIDLDGDGVVGDDEKVIDTGASLGAALTDTLEGGLRRAHRYRGHVRAGGGRAPADRATRRWRAQAAHCRATSARDFLQWTTRLFFTRGSSVVKVEHIAEERVSRRPSRAHQLRALYFLHTKIKTASQVQAQFGGDGACRCRRST